MAESNADDAARLCEDLARRQFHPRGPQRIGEALGKLLARKGYAQVQAPREWHALWAEVAGEKMAASSVVSKCTRGVLHVIVANSLLLQELGFRKKELLARIRELSDHKVRDVRFRIAPLD